jgi:hypothetical protein
MKILLASVLLLWSAAAFADPGDQVQWGVQTPGASWLSAAFPHSGNLVCWASAAAFAAAGENGTVKMYVLAKDSTVAGVTIYKASDCGLTVVKMAGQFMAGADMVAGKPGVGSMLVAKDAPQLTRAKSSLAYAAKLLGSK